MTTPSATAYIDIVPSTGNFAAELTRAIQHALSGVTTAVNQMTTSVNTSLTGVSANASRSLNGVAADAEKVGHRIGGSLKSAAVAAAGAFAGVQVGQLFTGFIRDAAESARISRITENVIASTGAAAKISADQVSALATAISNKTGADDEAIQSGSNLLLTFTGVRNEIGKGNDIFNQASAAAADMAAGLNDGDVSAGAIKSSALQLGKALNEPAKGLTALTRSGVSFTEQQKQQVQALVKSGDTLSAQKIILGELSKEFGGAAAAAGDPLTRLQTIAGNLGEDIGARLLPAVNSFANTMTSTIIPAISNLLPKVQEVGAGLVDFFTGQVLPVVQPVIDAFGRLGATIADAAPGLANLAKSLAPALIPFKELVELLDPRLIDALGVAVTALGKVGDFFDRHSTIVGAFAVAIGTVAASMLIASAATAAWTATTAGLVRAFWALDAAMSANPVGAIVVGILAAAAAFVYAWKKSETFRVVVVTGINAIKDAFVTVVKLIVDMWLKTVDILVSGAAHAFGWIPGIGGKLKAANDAFDAFASNVDGALQSIRDRDIKVTVNYKDADTPTQISGSRAQAQSEKEITRRRNDANAAAAKAAAEAAAKASARITVPRIPIPSISTGIGVGGGGGGGGAGSSAATAAKQAADARKRAAAAAAKEAAAAAKRAAEAVARALKAVRSEITARTFVDSITGGQEKIRSEFDKLLANLKAANAPKLAAYAASVEKTLLSVAVRRDRLDASLKAAKDKLADLKKTADDFGASVRASITSTGNLASANTINFIGVRNSLRHAVTDAAAFAKAVAALQKAGLNRAGLRQVIEAGPEAGLASARAILSGGKRGVAEVNKLQAQLDATGKALGASTENTFYGAGLKAAKGLVDGLASQEAALNKQMDRLAAAMVRALRAKLKIHSPSMVFTEMGHQVGRGLALGIDQSAAGAAGAGGRLGAAVTFGAGSVVVNGVSDPTRARAAGSIVGLGVADALARNQMIAALARS